MDTNKLTVIDKQQFSTNLLRITFSGESINEAFKWKPGCYIKLVFTANEKQVVRSYTVRSINKQTQQLVIDFALHEPAGPGNQWVRNIKKGDSIAYKGPGHLKIDTIQGDWYLFSADLSALPAALSTLENLPTDAKGYAFFEVPSEGDKQTIQIPKGIEVKWLIQPHTRIKSSQQLKAIQSIEILAGTPHVFIAGELSTIREIKQYLKSSKVYKNAPSYISSYWKIGVNSEGHKLAKKLRNKE